MLALFKNRNNDQNQEPAFKREVSVTGALTDILRPGLPAMYLYQGNLIRTSTVQAILEASASHVRFETLNSIYTISYNNQPGEGFRVTA
ncbi:hypothetical protein [Faecalibaculum rodentium]|jgi:hypothetical protein|uniref:hypothetical protein n=2 Tax=Bacteria TaxID=2 RepID=UPI002732155F|nr:hypothetical protein [Faecalibaculum rodentium]